jgi:hypothetical protein
MSSLEKRARVVGLWLLPGLLLGVVVWTRALWQVRILDWAAANNMDFAQLASTLLWVSVVWAAVMLGLVVFRPLPAQDERPWIRLRFRFLFAWLAGILLLGMWGPSLVATLAPQLVDSVMVLGNPLGLCVIWSAVIFLWLLHRGDGSPAYKRYLGDFRTIYTLLALILAAISLTDLAAYQSINVRVNGLQASVIAARDAPLPGLVARW